MARKPVILLSHKSTLKVEKFSKWGLLLHKKTMELDCVRHFSWFFHLTRIVWPKKIILKKTIIVSNKTGWLIDHYSIRKIYSIKNNVFDWKQQIENVLKEKIPESSVRPIFDEFRLGLQRIVARHYYSTLSKERKKRKKMAVLAIWQLAYYLLLKNLFLFLSRKLWYLISSILQILTRQNLN